MKDVKLDVDALMVAGKKAREWVKNLPLLNQEVIGAIARIESSKEITREPFKIQRNKNIYNEIF